MDYARGCSEHAVARPKHAATSRGHAGLRAISFACSTERCHFCHSCRRLPTAGGHSYWPPRDHTFSSRRQGSSAATWTSAMAEAT